MLHELYDGYRTSTLRQRWDTPVEWLNPQPYNHRTSTEPLKDTLELVA